MAGQRYQTKVNSARLIATEDLDEESLGELVDGGMPGQLQQLPSKGKFGGNRTSEGNTALLEQHQHAWNEDCTTTVKKQRSDSFENEVGTSKKQGTL